MADGKPSFFKSMWDGIDGYVKGGIVAALAGAAVGTVIGLGVGLLAPAAVMATAIGSVIGSAPLGGAVLGAILGGTTLFPIGALSGTITGVVKSRETEQPKAEEIAHVANASFTQGMIVGHQAAHEQEHSTAFRDRLAKEREAQMLAQKTR